METEARSLEASSGLSVRFMRELQPKVLVPSTTAGLVNGVLVIMIMVSFAALIFSGDLSDYVSRGIGLALYGALAIALVTALTSSFPGTVACPQDSPAAILAVVAGAIAGALAPSATLEATFNTVVAAIALTSLLAGALCLALGRFGLGGLVRYIPYPVIGGFLAGTGCLLIAGSMGLLTGVPLSLSSLASLFQADLWARWLPALIFAIALLAIMRRYSHYLIMPGLFLGAVGLFYLVLWLTGTSVDQAGAQEWLLGPFPEGALWRPLTPSALGAVNWGAILRQAGNIGTILVISIVSLLLNTTGLELTVRRDMDLNRELQSAGWANLLAGLGGGLTGYHALSLSALGHRMGTASRLVGLLVALLCGGMLLFGAPLLSLFPKPVIGGLLLFLGLAFVVEWVYDAWFKLPRAEYAIVLLIMITMPTVGILAGVGLGLVLALILFAVNYSRISVVKHTLSGSNYRSNVDRPRSYRQILRRKGDWLCILELQGFIFFGTANDLLDRVRQRIRDLELPVPRFVVLDFREVLGLDASAVLSFAKMTQLAHRYNIVLVFCHLPTEVRRRLEREVLTDEDRSVWHTEADLDHGVEWCEEQMLSILETERTPGEDSVQPGALTPIRTLVPGLEKYLERKQFKADTLLIGHGAAPQGLYFIVSGQVTAQLPCADGQMVRLRKMGPGSVVGEMGLYRDSEATASVLANEPSTADFLSAANLLRMEEEAPEVAVALHRYVALLLSERLEYANSTLQALLVEPVPFSVARS